MDESIAMLKAVWTQDPVSFKSRYIAAEIEDMRMTPQPSRPIPLWIGGTADATLARTIKVADGWHGSRLAPEKVEPIVRRLRTARPDPAFTVSMRMRWDGADDHVLADRIAAYRAIGVQHLLVEPESRETGDWDAVIEGVGRAAARS